MFKQYILPLIIFFGGVVMSLYYIPDNKNTALTVGSIVGTILVYSYKRIILNDTLDGAIDQAIETQETQESQESQETQEILRERRNSI